MTAIAPVADAGTAHPLRRLYLARSGFAVVWAALLFATGSEIGPVSATLIVLYPLVDAAAAIADLRSSGQATPARALYANAAISLLAAAGLAVACASGVPAALRVWGVWAIVAGLLQLLAGVARRELGGQWPMILSGGISVLAGTSFIAAAAADDPTMKNVAGYALLGGIFFLVSALRLRRP